MKNSGFTLAEVLITLAIIGIISAITIPSLFNEVDIDNKEAQIKINKTISAIDQATKMLVAENRNIANVCDDGDDECLRDAYCRYLNCVKNDVTLSYKKEKPMYGAAWAEMPLIPSSVQLADETFLEFENLISDGKCTGSSDDITAQFGEATGHYESELCGTIFIDINANKKPNEAGIDRFKIGIVAKGIRF